MNTEKVFEILTKVAELTDPVSRMRISAALVYKKNILSLGKTQYKSHPLQNRFKRNPHSIWLHAEIDCIRRVKRLDILPYCTLYICRIKKASIDSSPMWSLSKPCIGCQKAIEAFNIKKVIYTIDSSPLQYEELIINR